MKIDRQQFLDELKLREQIRKAISVIRERKQKKAAAVLSEEKRLRKVIRKILNEEEGQGDESTGISYLRRDLKKIIPELEEGYKSLRSKQEQRDSYRAHILNAIKDLIIRGDTNFNARADKDPDEEAVGMDLREEIDIKIGDDMPDPQKKLDIGREAPESEKVDKKTEEDEELEDFAISGEDKTGAAAALTSMKQIEKVIINTYSTLYDPNDRDLYSDYLITNLQLYFDEFEKELQAVIPEPENPDYEQRKDTEESPELGMMGEDSDPI